MANPPGEGLATRGAGMVGGRVADWFAEVGRITLLVGDMLRVMLRKLPSPRLLIEQMQAIGVDSLWLVIVVSIRLVGLILVNAILVMPGATALLLSRRLSTVLWSAGVIGVLGTTGGLVVSIEVGALAPGACIVAALTVLFAGAYLYSRVLRSNG